MSSKYFPSPQDIRQLQNCNAPCLRVITARRAACQHGGSPYKPSFLPPRWQLPHECDEAGSGSGHLGLGPNPEPPWPGCLSPLGLFPILRGYCGDWRDYPSQPNKIQSLLKHYTFDKTWTTHISEIWLPRRKRKDCRNCFGSDHTWKAPSQWCKCSPLYVHPHSPLSGSLSGLLLARVLKFHKDMHWTIGLFSLIVLGTEQAHSIQSYLSF